MDAIELMAETGRTLTAKRVFGEPYEKDGVTIIPAATVGGGGGSGIGEGTETQGKGSGGGFGLTARPVGAFVIKNGEVSWRPAFDANRALQIGGVIAVIGLFTIRSLVRARAKTKRSVHA